MVAQSNWHTVLVWTNTSIGIQASGIGDVCTRIMDRWNLSVSWCSIWTIQVLLVARFALLFMFRGWLFFYLVHRTGKVPLYKGDFWPCLVDEVFVILCVLFTFACHTKRNSGGIMHRNGWRWRKVGVTAGSILGMDGFQLWEHVVWCVAGQVWMAMMGVGSFWRSFHVCLLMLSLFQYFQRVNFFTASISKLVSCFCGHVYFLYEKRKFADSFRETQLPIQEKSLCRQL